MAEARLQSELADTKAEFQRLRDQIFRGTVQKDLSMVSLIPKWSGSDKAIPLEEFFRSIEGTARIRNERPGLRTSSDPKAHRYSAHILQW